MFAEEVSLQEKDGDFIPVEMFPVGVLGGEDVDFSETESSCEGGEFFLELVAQRTRSLGKQRQLWKIRRRRQRPRRSSAATQPSKLYHIYFSRGDVRVFNCLIWRTLENFRRTLRNDNIEPLIQSCRSTIRTVNCIFCLRFQISSPNHATKHPNVIISENYITQSVIRLIRHFPETYP